MSQAGERPIGIFDSGIGGLTVLQALRELLPEESLAYVADQAHLPYGPRPAAELRSFAAGIACYLLERGAKLLVVACNAASAAALLPLRAAFPGVPIVGLEPAVKPAAETSRTGVIGVLATPGTLSGQLYASVVERFAGEVRLLEHACPGLVQQIEKGELDTPATRVILEDALRPMLELGADTLVLGCTHYPLVIPLLRDIAGPQVRVIDPAPAVARQVARVLDERGLRCAAGSQAEVRLFTTGAPQPLERLLPRLTGENRRVRALRWTAAKEGLRLEEVEPTSD